MTITIIPPLSVPDRWNSSSILLAAKIQFFAGLALPVSDFCFEFFDLTVSPETRTLRPRPLAGFWLLSLSCRYRFEKDVPGSSQLQYNNDFL